MYDSSRYFDGDKKFRIKLLGDDILLAYGSGIKTLRDTEEMYVYKNGVYEKVGVSFIKEEVNENQSYDRNRKDFWRLVGEEAVEILATGKDML